MSHVKIWIHAVWGTKNRHPFLTKEIKAKVISHIKENARTKEIFISRLDGHTEHLHALIGLNAEMSISKTMQLIKGESAFWINKNNITPLKFAWADEYYAVSVSESHLPRLNAYIKNQEEHHKKATSAEEYERFMANYTPPSQG
jgi:putative transposase